MAGDFGKTFGRTALTAVGFGLGSMAGYPAIGASIGMSLGSYIFPPKTETKVRQVRSALGTSSVEGTPVTVVFGRVRVGGTLMWAGDFVYHQIVKKKGGKGGGSSTVVADAWYTLSFAMAIGEGPMGLHKIYEGKNVVSPSYTFYQGTGTQSADAFLTAQTGKSIAYKHTAYIVFQDYVVGPTAQLPQLTFEVTKPPAKVNGNIIFVKLFNTSIKIPLINPIKAYLLDLYTIAYPQ